MVQRYLRLSKEIEFELAEIGKIVAEGTGFSSSYREVTPGSLELRGFGAILHDFYNGIENICERIANEIDGGLPKGDDWHWRLLESMALELPKLRPALFSVDIVNQLDEYRRFRHIFRHMYGTHLDWKRIKFLLDKLNTVFSGVEKEIKQFIGFLTALSE
jgi:hypothetical protein